MTKFTSIHLDPKVPGRSLAPYSNFGPTIDVAAPGGDMSADLNGDGYLDGVPSTRGDDSSGSIVMDYSFLQGTSMASPHVAGVIALMKSVDPSLTPTQFDTLLASGALAIDLGAPGLGEKAQFDPSLYWVPWVK